MILHSTPHLYLSALPFSPVNSTIAKFTPKFPNNLCLKSGCHSDRTAVEIVISGHTAGVMLGVFSPDGSCIVSGSWDKTVAVGCSNGTAIGQTLGRGHTGVVQSVKFSPDGTHIVSGLEDNTVQLWSAVTEEPLGELLEGHTREVYSVSFSPDGTRLASGSRGNTVRLQHAAFGQACQEYTEASSSVFTLDRTYTTPPIQKHPTMSPITWNHHFISFSSSFKLEHVLCNPTDLLEGNSQQDSNSTPFWLRQADGWMMGPDRRLLFWVPPASRYAFYTPRTSLVIPRGGVELDLSRMAHGTRWSDCRDV
jgi:WD40 repeat protein